MLKEFNDIKINSPDVFYNLIKSKFTLNRRLSNGTAAHAAYEIEGNFQLSDLLKFSCELSELFMIQKS